MNDWHTIDSCPEGRYVMTKIDDKDGCRNESARNRQGRLFFSGDMYCYYTPTHWRELTPQERKTLKVVQSQSASIEEVESK